MLTWAKKGEAESCLFRRFREKNGICDRHGSRLRDWEYAWAYFSSELDVKGAVLDVGSGYSFFPEIVSRNHPGIQVVSVDTAYSQGAPRLETLVSSVCADASDLPFQKESFDVVYLISVIEHFSSVEQSRAMKEASRVIKPGGRIIATVDYFFEWPKWENYQKAKKQDWLPERNVNVRELVEESGLLPFRSSEYSVFPGHHDFIESDLEIESLVTSEHVRPGLLVGSIGLVLVKPYTEEDLRHRIFSVNGAWMRQKSGELTVLGGWKNDLGSPTGVTLPVELIAKQEFGFDDFAEALSVENVVAAVVLTELLVQGLILDSESGMYVSNAGVAGDNLDFRVSY